MERKSDGSASNDASETASKSSVKGGEENDGQNIKSESATPDTGKRAPATKARRDEWIRRLVAGCRNLVAHFRQHWLKRTRNRSNLAGSENRSEWPVQWKRWLKPSTMPSRILLRSLLTQAMGTPMGVSRTGEPGFLASSRSWEAPGSMEGAQAQPGDSQGNGR